MLSCCVCFDTEDTAWVSGSRRARAREASAGARELTNWHHCKTCSAMWCDTCMESMYEEARDNREYDVHLSCPQCRTSVADMQAEARLERLVDLGCASSEMAELVLLYENLFTELLHMCETKANGEPHYTVELHSVARTLSRDETCDIAHAVQGAAADSRLRRSLRGGDYPSAALVVLRGYVDILSRAGVCAASKVACVEWVAHYLRKTCEVANEEPAIAERRAALLEGVEGILEGQREPGAVVVPHKRQRRH